MPGLYQFETVRAVGGPGLSIASPFRRNHSGDIHLAKARYLPTNESAHGRLCGFGTLDLGADGLAGICRQRAPT